MLEARTTIQKVDVEVHGTSALVPPMYPVLPPDDANDYSNDCDRFRVGGPFLDDNWT
jgi:hypothetical protein